MPTRIAPDLNELSIYQEFVDRTTIRDDEIVFSVDKTKDSPASLKSASTQTTFQKIYRWLFGQKKSDIVNEFSAALEAKYGKEIASFAFSETQKTQALNAGLSKRIIAEVLKNASFARDAQDDFEAYASMAETNINIATEADIEIEITALREKFQKVQDFANRPLSDFKNVDTLQAALHEAMRVATTSKDILQEKVPASLKLQSPIIIPPDAEETRRTTFYSKDTDRGSISPTTVAIDTDFDGRSLSRSSSLAHSDEIESTWKEIPDAPISEKAFQTGLEITRRQHQEVMSELKRRFERNPKALEAQLTELAGAVIEAIQKAAPELMAFAHHVDDDPSNHFCLDTDGTIIVRPADSANSKLTAEEVAQENQKVWRLFYSTLETCYGKPLLERMIPKEQREELFSTPLTTGYVKQAFEEMQHALEIDLKFLTNQPFIVDDAYYSALLNDQELLEKALQAEREAAARGTSSIEIGRKLFDVGVLTAGYHAGGLVAAGVATTVTTITGVAVPIIPLTFVASTLCSWMAGRIVGSRTSQEVGSFAANRAATYTIGAAGTEIASKPLIDSLRDYLTHCLAHLTVGPESADAIAFLTQFALEEGGSIIADNIRHACIGSVVNGINVATLPAHPDGLHPTQAADMDLRVIDILQNMTHVVSQLSPPASHEHVLKRPRVLL